MKIQYEKATITTKFYAMPERLLKLNRWVGGGGYQ